MSTIIIIIFAICTIIIVWFTWWISLRQRRYHGIFRFFAFESILVLSLLNYPVWFKDPFSLHQIISWVLLILSILVAAIGFQTLYSKGNPTDQMENTSKLITTGVYKYIRHPMYLSLMLVGFGVLVKDCGYLQCFFAIINFIALILTARVEEKEMIIKFGEDYRIYMKKTKMFIPFVF
jgi:protein-S-isoprenylcysteine O-methyltransferase Ste14